MTHGVGVLIVLKAMSKFSFWVAFIATLLIFESCRKKNETPEQTGNSKFIGFVGADSLSKKFKFNEGNPIKISIYPTLVDSKVRLSDFLGDYRLLSLKNWEGGVVGDVDKILLTDSLIFILDQYTYNSLQIFNFFTGEQVGLFYPTGEGPGEIKNITEFDLDEANSRILIYDNSLAKILYFTFDGHFLFEKRLPLRAHSFKIFPENQLLFSSIGDANDHLGITGTSDLFLLDSNYSILNTYEYPQIDQNLSHFVPRDVIRENSGMVTYFPRFSNELLQIDWNTNSLKSLIQIDLSSEGLSQEDLKNIGPEFTTERKEDKKFFGFGLHFVTPNWIGMKFDRFGGPELQVYYNRKNEKISFGTSVDFDFEDLIFYSFPMVCRGNICVTNLKLGYLKDKQLDEYFKKIGKNGRDFSKIKKYLETIEDFEQPVLLVFTMK